MADTKITALTAITTVDPANDVLPIVDVSDTSMAASGTTKKITTNQLLGASGTATLASATITGDLTVATDRLKVVTASTAIQTGATTQLQVGTTSWPSTVIGKSGSRSLFGNAGEVIIWNETAAAIGNYSTLFVTAKTGAGATTMGGLQIRAGIENASNSDGFVSLWTSNNTAGGFVERYKIDSTGVATWSNVGGVAGTAMTLNSNGLGVGTSPAATIHAYGSGSSTAAVRLQAASGRVFDVGSTGSGYGAANNFIIYDVTAGSERLRIDASGNCGIGVAPSATMKLDVQGQNIRLNSGSATGFSLLRLGGTASDSFFGFAGLANDIVTGTSAGDTVIGSNKAGANLRFISGNGALNATLDASGNLLVGTTSMPSGVTFARLVAKSTSGDWSGVIWNSNATPYGFRIQHDTDSNGTGNEFLYCLGGANLRASIRSNGGIANYQANNVSLSDSRLKTDIKPLASYWNKIKSLELVTFKYKDQTHSDDNIGLIAQQVESVAPELVDVDGFGETPDDGVPIKTIYTTDLYHAAIKALQEAMTRIEALESKLA